LVPRIPFNELFDAINVVPTLFVRSSSFPKTLSFVAPHDFTFLRETAIQTK
jgi:hypothetical protein